ncbi:MAG: hypothetical protein J5544_03155 [Clostridia bacterium]|nr:hypothetical protein [Clostridia bacterium]
MELLQFRRKRRRLKKGVLAIIIGFLFVAVAAMLAVIWLGGAEDTLKKGSLSAEKSYSAVVIRSEKVVTTEEFDTADYFAADGQLVEPGDPIMNVYRMGFSREITNSLWETQEEIYRAQLAVLGETRDPQLRAYDDSIRDAKDKLSSAVLDGSTALVEKLSGELTQLLTERNEYLRVYVQETEALRALYQKEADWQETVDQARIRMTADRAGKVSYYLDDFAVVLNSDKLNNITSDLINTALKKSKTAKWTGSSRTNAYRIVNTGEWYCAFLTGADEKMRLSEGEEYAIEAEGYGEFRAVALRSFVSGKYVVNILKISEDPGELINVRAITLKVKIEADGLIAESRAIRMKDGVPYIELVQPDGRVNMYVDVLADDGRKAVIKARTTEEVQIGEGTKYWIPTRFSK